MHSLNDLAVKPIWVYWKLVKQGENPTKVPYSPRTNEKVGTTPEYTHDWTARPFAEEASVRDHGEGVGIIFTEIEPGLLLCGIDLDSCREPNNGHLADWAYTIIHRFSTYTEISPSNTGVKLFFIINKDVLADFKSTVSMEGHSKVWRQEGKSGLHPPAIELHFSHRYFTVTNQHIGPTEGLREVPLSDLLWLYNTIGPTFDGRGKTKKKKSDDAVFLTDVESALEIIPNDDVDWDEWNKIGMAVYAATGGLSAGKDLFNKWSSSSSKHNDAGVNERWSHYKTSPPTGTGAGALFKRALEANPNWAKPSETGSVSLSADWFGDQFADTFKEKFRYISANGQWWLFKGNVWQLEQSEMAFNEGRLMLRGIVTALYAPVRVKQRYLSKQNIDATVAIGRKDPRIAVVPDIFDADPFLLGTPAGVVDLKTGQLHKGKAADYISKSTRVAPGGECPRWMQFLKEITNDDAPLISYMQRIAGYWLTGLTIEHALFFFYGSGRNGKSTFINTIIAIMGGYAGVVAMNTLLVTPHTEHPTEIARLKGVRMAVAAETNEGARWNSAKIKLLTGGDKLTARFMRGDFFDFVPSHKLIVLSNRKPAIGMVDDAIRGRLAMIPFNQKFIFKEDDAGIVDGKPGDKYLQEKLEAEYGGILTWMIEGCKTWRSVGLHPPKIVQESTEDYLNSQDDIQMWMDECCEVEAQAVETSTRLYNSWKAWAMARNTWVGSQKEWSERLEKKFTKYRDNAGAKFKGLKVADSIGF